MTERMTLKQFVNFTADCQRRDFTINAMSASFEGDILDPFGGQEDLQAGVVRFVGDADRRIQEDYLRILRWFRFRGRFEKGEPDWQDVDAVVNNAPGLAQISRERVWSEIARIVSGAQGPDLMWQLNHMGVAYHVDLPTHLTDFIFDADLVHTRTRNPVTLMVSMYGAQSVKILRAWKASGAEIQLAWGLEQAISCKQNPFWCRAMMGWSLAHAQELACLLGWDQFDRAVLDAWDVPVFPVSGDDLIALGMKPGPGMGQMLTDLRNRWAHSGYMIHKQDLLNLVPKNNS